ncbi:MAG: recombination protein RecR [Candidatus Amulumruptor caecigallinarius]|uniref:Recombination protein RecR n=1 Tax=Candidatus Amulumruptor caecigallinarius TaxID=2109911 RepID=A0A4Q0UB08_9BACT|nr:MAG: recombination protein RecR [Candidatus Amulumruptor caecigallinarius]HJE38989.1 recombination mediator RecR [Candidatus Amulumruptor caecigallinarius]
MQHDINSILLDNAVNALAQLPGIGKKTALRLALHILRRDESEGVAIGQSLIDLRRGIRYCRVCHNISDDEVCAICGDDTRDRSKVCVVESIKDVINIEATRQFSGLYHVLGGVISPMDGIGPDMLEIKSLIDRVEREDVREVILALGATMEGETTSFYLYRKLRHTGVEITQLARGVAIGNELEYTDEVTLGRSILNRMPFQG